jgi:hypothetical protein
MKRLVSMLLLYAYPLLVFSDTIYFKNGQTIEGELIDYKNNITFRIPNPKFDISWTFPASGMVLEHSKSPKGSIIKHVDNQTFVFRKKHVFMVNSRDTIIRFSLMKVTEIETEPENHQEILSRQINILNDRLKAKTFITTPLSSINTKACLILIAYSISIGIMSKI